ncbi:MAG: DUF2079 domain-containing protein [Thermoleophilia bacterium]|nr:DUF2079 domain-containing protein [Thermoleophilia bacterium]
MADVKQKYYFLVTTAGAVSGALTALDLTTENGSSGSSRILWILLSAVAGAMILAGAWFLSSPFLTLREREASEKNSPYDEALPAAEARNLAAWPFAFFAALPLLFAPFIYYRGKRVAHLPDSNLLNPNWQIYIVLAASAGLVFSMLAFRFVRLRKGPINAAGKHPAVTLTFIIGVWLVLACTMDILKTHYLHEAGDNIPIFADALNHAFSEDGTLYSKLLQANGSSLLGIHASFIWYLVYPLYIVWPRYEWLLTISNLALALAAIPLYLITKQYLGRGAGLLITLVYLFNRTIFSQPGIADITEERFLPVLLLTAFYFWTRKKFWPFLGFACLALTVREDMGIVLALLGVYSLIARRDWKWWLAPIVIGGGWFVVMVKWFIPSMNPFSEATRPLIIYSSLGENGSEIIKTLLFRPWRVIKVLFSDSAHLASLYGLWQSFGFGVTFLSASMIIAGPALAETLLIPQPSLSHFNVIAIAAALFPSMILGTARLEAFTRKRWNQSVAIPLLLLTLFSTAALSYTWFSPGKYEARYNYDTAMAIMSAIPPDTSVILPDYMIIKAQPGQDVRGYYQVPYEISQDGSLTIEQEYVVVDEDIPEVWQGNRYYEGVMSVRDLIAGNPDFELLVDQDDLRLFRNRAFPVRSDRN